MFKHVNTTLIALGCIFALTGCIHKDYPPCEPLKVNLIVADKNYSNVNEVDEEDAVDERLPFRTYIPTMCYVLRDAKTGEVVDRSEIVPTSATEATHTITFPAELPHGTYDMIVWGGIKDFGTLEFDNDPSTAAFHTTPDDDEDIYLGHATVVYEPFETNMDLQMKRTMGKLIVIKELVGKAEGVTRTQKVVTDVCSYVDRELNYNGANKVTFNHSFDPAPEVISKTILAPSVEQDKTRFHIEFFNDTPHARYPVLIPEDVNITILPNELTVLRYVYNSYIEKFDIYVKKHNEWEKIYKLDLID